MLMLHIVYRIMIYFVLEIFAKAPHDQVLSDNTVMSDSVVRHRFTLALQLPTGKSTFQHGNSYIICMQHYTNCALPTRTPGV